MSLMLISDKSLIISVAPLSSSLLCVVVRAIHNIPAVSQNASGNAETTQDGRQKRGEHICSYERSYHVSHVVRSKAVGRIAAGEYGEYPDSEVKCDQVPGSPLPDQRQKSI